MVKFTKKMMTFAAGIAMLVAGCESVPNTGRSTVEEMEKTEVNQDRLVAAVPPPRLDTSLERKNLVRRLQHLNREGQTSYMYLISYGKVMAFYTVSGKVSSLNSLLTTPEQIVTVNGSSAGGYHQHVLPSPDFDGSYGKNDDGVFFFTTEGAYVEWHGDYLWADQPLKITQSPELVLDITPKAPGGAAPTPGAAPSNLPFPTLRGK
jgi:hypothetical protein